MTVAVPDHTRVRWWFGAAVVAVVTFTYRLLTPDFSNDHFEHLSMARQMLAGELPSRDFFDPGRPLTIALSAGAQLLLGRTLFSEAMLAIGALAVGTAMTFWLAGRASRSVACAAAAAVFVVAIYPRLYAYPKILVFAVVVLTLWRYYDAPTRPRLLAVSAATTFAFLMRHDFGLYAAVVAMCGIGAFHRVRHCLQPLTLFVVGALLLVSPYLIWSSANGRLLTDSVGGTRALVGAARVDWRPLNVHLSRGLLYVTPVRADVALRWDSSVDATQRVALEREYSLVSEYVEDHRTFHYGLTDDSPAQIRRLLSDPRVVHVDGIDREAARPAGSWFARWIRASAPGRVRWQPVFEASDAEAWLYDLVWLLPIAAATCLVAGRGVLQDPQQKASPQEGLKIFTVVVLAVVLNLFLIRGSLDSRLPDVVVPAAILAAWLLHLAADAMRRTRRQWVRGASIAAIAVVLVGTWIALATYTGNLSALRIATAAVRWPRLMAITSDLKRRPLDVWTSPDSVGVRALTRYVAACTTPEDRVLVVAYEPEVFYLSERLFAGGMEVFHQRRFSSARDQAQIVGKLRRERVPLVIVENARWHMLQDDYSMVFRDLQARYVQAAASTFNGDAEFSILTERNRAPVSSERGLPCYTAAGSTPAAQKAG